MATTRRRRSSIRSGSARGRRRLALRWSGPALDDLRAIRGYVSRDDPTAAARLARRIREAVDRLRDYPLAARAVPELPRSPYREAIVAPYRIVVTVEPQAIFVVRVWHARREMPPLE
jgi:plasmid stabilization system protein ParE